MGEEIHFYVAVPKSYEQIFEKQVHGIFSTAELERIKDYNIFNHEGVSLGAYLKLKENPILPIKTYQLLEADPLGAILSSLSKLEKEHEGAAIQILIRPSHHNEIRVNAQKVAKEMQSGLDFKTAVKRVKKPLTKEEQQKEAENPNLSRAVAPLEGEMIKAI